MLSHTTCLPSCRQGGKVRHSHTLRSLGEYKKWILKKVSFYWNNVFFVMATCHLGSVGCAWDWRSQPSWLKSENQGLLFL